MYMNMPYRVAIFRLLAILGPLSEETILKAFAPYADVIEEKTGYTPRDVLAGMFNCGHIRLREDGVVLTMKIGDLFPDDFTKVCGIKVTGHFKSTIPTTQDELDLLLRTGLKIEKKVLLAIQPNDDARDRVRALMRIAKENGVTVETFTHIALVGADNQ